MSDRTQDAGEKAPSLTEFETLIEHARELEAGSPSASEWPSIDPERFRLLRMLGQGGMGVVFLARQLQPIRREVAIKLIRRRVRNSEGLARFEVECQALARMQHPNIAQVHDAGATVDGHPYLVMEFVDGLPLNLYCQSHCLNVEQRLRLFIQVCRGVQHAHQKGIIHRDLKPANILVSQIDHVAIPKIIDFGIAARVGSEAAGQTQAHAGTPHYMSPEQFHEAEAGLDTRSDVYSLGAILYELLVDQLPIARSSFSAATRLSDMTTAFQQPRRRPSEHLSEPSLNREIAAERRTSIRRLRHRLRNDLDQVVMKALALAPESRYASAGDFADDIERVLQHQPVSAVPALAMYRARKFVRRNLVALGSASAILLAMLAGLTAATMGMIEAQRQYRIAEERQLELEQLTRFQQAMLEGIDPRSMGEGILEELRRQWQSGLKREGQDPLLADNALGAAARHVNATDLARQTLSRHILERAIESVEREFVGQPALQAELYTAIHAVYRAINLPERLPELADRILQHRRQSLGPTAHEVLDDELNLAWAYYLTNDLQQAEFRFTDIISRLDRSDPGHRELLIQAQGNRATVLVDQGRLDEAMSLIGEGVELAGDWLGPDHPLSIRTTSTAGFVHARARNFERGLLYFEQALLGMRKTLAADDPALGRAMLNVASALGQLGRQSEALELDYEIVDFFATTQGRRSHDTLRAMSNMANNLAAVGRLDESIRMLSETSELASEFLGPDHPLSLRVRLNLGSTLARQGERERGQAILEEVVEQRLEVLGPDHQETLGAQEVLASILLDRGLSAEAVPLLEELLERRLALFGAEHPQTMTAHQLLGRSLLGSGQHERAEAHTPAAFEYFLERLGPDHQSTLAAALEWYRLALALGQSETAERLWNQHLEVVIRPDAPTDEHAWLIRRWAELSAEKSP